MSVPVVLASGSPRRRELLGALGLEFEVVVSNVDEPPIDGDPVAGAVALAVSKARAVASTHPGRVVLAADTVVHDGIRDYGKPLDTADAERMLTALRGTPHRVVTGVAVLTGEVTVTGASVSTVTLTNMDDATIRAYVASGRPLDKAGAYAIQDRDVPTVACIDGCYCGVMGLPLWLVRQLLARAGIDASAPDAVFARCAACPERPGGSSFG